MSLFDDIAHAIGHTAESLAMDVGAGAYEIESLINDLASNGIDVFSIAERFGLSVVGFLRSMVNILRGDPHQQLLGYITRPFKPVNAHVEALSTQWGQMAQFHQETAQMINMHISGVFQGNGTFSYSGQAAEALWNTHEDYLSSFQTNVWGKALRQAEKYITVDHATSVIIELPQQGIHGNPGPSRQQLQLLQNLERRYPDVKFEVRMGSPDPGLQIPFDPPATNWGASLP